MNILQGLIINSDINGVRKIAKENKEWLLVKTENNEYPIELARKKGIHRIEVAIARNINFRQFYSISELQSLLIDYIFEISEEYFCAG